jgi:LmbE family N-acetylglucosaminyl deacetylase
MHPDWNHHLSEESVVAVVAHPDDAELLCFGTLLRYAKAGAAVSVLAVSNGIAGVSLTDEEAGRVLTDGERWSEMEEAFEGTGIQASCLGLPDGELRCDRSLISRIERVLLDRSCTVLITHCTGSASDHQDHRAVGEAAVNAATRVASCRCVLHGEPHAPFSGFAPSVFVDITDQVAAKVRALKAHRSQAGRWYLSEEFIRQRAATAAWRSRPQAAASGRLYEAFECSMMVLGGANGALA